jgi:hypothetical protein
MKWTVLFIWFLAINTISGQTKICGVNYVSPISDPSNPQTLFQDLLETNANWVALTPFIQGHKNAPEMEFSSPDFRWGDQLNGIERMIFLAKNQGLSVFLKPHTWIHGSGWPGEFRLNSEEEWNIWEKQYSKIILDLAALCQRHKVEMFSIGVEWKYCVLNKPQFWEQLIKEVREIYSGKLTYCSNWDNYDQVGFWSALDYIAIDAYFPLCQKECLDTILNSNLILIKSELKKFCEQRGKKVMFSEYGYRSVDNALWKQWELPPNWESSATNYDLQNKGYEVIYDTFWDENWFIGGFLWKWFSEDDLNIGLNSIDYTPQNKPALRIIRNQYKKSIK